MPNIKISKKGKALLRRSFSSGEVVNALVTKGKDLHSKEGVLVSIDGRNIRVRSAASRDTER